MCICFQSLLTASGRLRDGLVGGISGLVLHTVDGASGGVTGAAKVTDQLSLCMTSMWTGCQKGFDWTGNGGENPVDMIVTLTAVCCI